MHRTAQCPVIAKVKLESETNVERDEARIGQHRAYLEGIRSEAP